MKFLAWLGIFIENWLFRSKSDVFGKNWTFFGKNYTTWELFNFRFRFWIVLEGLNGLREYLRQVLIPGCWNWNGLQPDWYILNKLAGTSLIKSLKILVNRMSLTSIFRNTKRSKWTFGLITNESNHSNKNPISSKMKIFTISIPSRNGTF